MQQDEHYEDYTQVIKSQVADKIRHMVQGGHEKQEVCKVVQQIDRLIGQLECGEASARGPVMSDREKQDTLQFLRDQLKEIAYGSKEKKQGHTEPGMEWKLTKNEGSGFKPPLILKSNKSFESLRGFQSGVQSKVQIQKYQSKATPRKECISARGTDMPIILNENRSEGISIGPFNTQISANQRPQTARVSSADRKLQSATKSNSSRQNSASKHYGAPRIQQQLTPNRDLSKGKITRQKELQLKQLQLQREKAHNQRILDTNNRLENEIRELKEKINREKKQKEMKKKSIEIKKKTKELSFLSTSITTDLELNFKSLVQHFIATLEQHQSDFRSFREDISAKYSSIIQVEELKVDELRARKNELNALHEKIKVMISQLI